MQSLGDSFGQSIPAILDACRQPLREGLDDNFSRRGRADGSAWPARKDPGDGHPLLEETGALRAATTTEGAEGHIERIADGTLTMGVDRDASKSGGIPGARVHQHGYPPRNIAEREFVAISAATADRCAEIAADRLAAEVA